MRAVRKRSRMRVKRGEGRGSCSITVANVILLFVDWGKLFPRGSSDKLFKKFNLREGSWNQSSKLNRALDLK